jgi:hypothetical protein
MTFFRLGRPTGMVLRIVSLLVLGLSLAGLSAAQAPRSQVREARRVIRERPRHRIVIPRRPMPRSRNYFRNYNPPVRVYRHTPRRAHI